MSTPQSVTHVVPRIRVGHATRLTALGLLVAIFVSIVTLALSHTNHTSATIPFKAFEPTGASVVKVHRLGR
jgi:hypothetical protein